jgi:UDP-N-acetyl-D-glucosamine/UDP-N-acetyl-D-galactosamine dehydrogenase
MGHKRKIAVIGLGYVGLNIAVAFGRKFKIIGLDINPVRISELKEGYDRNGNVSKTELSQTNILYTEDPNELQNADFHIIVVSTPLTATHHPDLSHLVKASEMVGKQLKKGDIVVYESTVYPGATEEICIPALEKSAKLLCPADFGVGYSPERVNPGDTVHTFETIIKVVSAVDQSTLAQIQSVYNEVITVGTHPVSAIKVAEASKILENTQRDINIAFMNEAAIILHHCNVEISEVIAAAQTKWNFNPYKPGLVGGHCIGNNSYYLAHKSMHVGYIPHLIFAALDVNNAMPNFLAEEVNRNLEQMKVPVKQARVAVLGITYKADYSDFHDSKVMILIDKLKNLGMNVVAHDPLADYSLVRQELDLDLVSWDELSALDAIVIAVAHKAYCQLEAKQLEAMMNPKAFIMDVMGAIRPSIHFSPTIRYWKI